MKPPDLGLERGRRRTRGEHYLSFLLGLLIEGLYALLGMGPVHHRKDTADNERHDPMPSRPPFLVDLPGTS